MVSWPGSSVWSLARFFKYEINRLPNKFLMEIAENVNPGDLTPLNESRFWVRIIESGKRKEVRMARRRFTPEQIIGMLREAEVRLSQGEKVKGICRSFGITEQTYYRWRKDYGGMKVSQARRLKDLERENGRLKKAVAELTLDKLILKEALEGNY
jgi:putative transposase